MAKLKTKKTKASVAVGGDGKKDSAVKLTCERGNRKTGERGNRGTGEPDGISIDW